MGLKVLSLFDGIACGLMALERAKIKVDEYHAFEIDYNCIKVAKANHQNKIVHYGSVENYDFNKFKNIDLLIGGSPCQGFSKAGNNLGFDDPRSKLYFEFERARFLTNPKYFLLENTKMDWSYQYTINRRLGVIAQELNSNKVSAQNRTRLYWKNWNCKEPYDFNIKLKDILQTNLVDLAPYKVNKTPSRDKMWYGGKCKNITNSDKSSCLTTKHDRWSNAGLIEFDDYCRFLTPIECERLQTLPDNYTNHNIYDSERYVMLGNCWTINMISWLFWFAPFGNSM